MLDEKPFDYIVCIRASKPTEVVGATKEVCSCCGSEVWVAPKSRAFLGKIPIICVECVLEKKND